jgi:hypothetical protein
MPNLLLSPTRRYFRIGDKDDYCVLDGGRVIGRIFLQPQAPALPPNADMCGATRDVCFGP